MEPGWLSRVIEQLWPFAKEAIQKQAWAALPTLLNDAKAGWMVSLVLKRFELGDAPPSITNIESVKETTVTGQDTLHLNFDFQWESSQCVFLEVTPLPKALRGMVPETVITTLEQIISFQTGVSKFKGKARFRVTLEPLLYKSPLFGDIKFAFVKQPEEIDFELDLPQGLLAVLGPMIPLLKEWLIQFLRVSILDKFLILPEQIAISFAQDEEMLEVPHGMVYVKVLKARDVPKVDLVSKAEPYVGLWLREKKMRVTPVRPKGHHAEWNVDFKLPVVDRPHQVLTLCIYDHNPFGGDDELGRAVVDLQSLPTNEMQDFWLEMHPAGEREAQEELRHQLGSSLLRSIIKGTVNMSQRVTGATSKCLLHVQVTYQELSDDDVRAIAEYKVERQIAVLTDRVSPIALEIADSGTLHALIRSASKLPRSLLAAAHSRYIQARLKVGGQEVSTISVKVNQKGARIEQELQVQLASARDGWEMSLQVTIEVWDVTFIQNMVGYVIFPFGMLKAMKRLKGKHPLEKHGRSESCGVVDVDIRWDPFLQ